MAIETTPMPRMHHHGAFPIVPLLRCFLFCFVLGEFSLFLLEKRILVGSV